MIFNNIDYKNQFIDIKKQRIQIDKIGLYIVKGANGSGKSSIIKKIIFELNEMDANTKEQEDAYKNNRKNLIAYVPQNIYAPDISIYSYITKNDKEVSKDLLDYYMEKFSLSHLDYSQSVRQLSGGEITKICIISALIKNTPYIFMDEPSNNLDDSSVQILKDVIEEIRKEKTIILISHDIRLSFENHNNILFENGQIKEDNSYGESNTIKPKISKAVSKFKIGFKLQLGINSILTFVFFLAVIAGIILFNQNEFSSNYADYSDANSMPEKNTIMAYVTSSVYDEENQIYTKAAGINVDESKYYNLISCNAIPQISKNNGINDIYLYDFSKTEKIVANLKNKSYREKNIICASLPQDIYKNYLNITGLQDIFSLKKGRYPKDGCNEVVLSENLIKRLGLKHEKIDINSQVEIQGKSYKIVGIGVLDFAWVSYEEGKNSTFYKYDESTYKDYCERNIAEKKVQEYKEPTEIDNVFIVTKDDQEKNVLDYLMSEYPANNYSSYAYTIKWIEEYNKPICLKILIIDCLIAFFSSIVLLFLIKSIIENDIIKIVDYENYYICNKAIRNSYIFFKSIIQLILIMVSLILNEIFCHRFFESRICILASLLIMTLSMTIYYLLRFRKGREK